MNWLLVLHLLSLGVWTGCIATEVVFEHGMGRNPQKAADVAALHVAVDKWVEIPAFLAVLVTGAIMAYGVPLTPLFQAKILAGIGAIACNIICVWQVRARHAAYVAGDIERARKFDHWQHKTGGVLGILLVLTFALAIIARSA